MTDPKPFTRELREQIMLAVERYDLSSARHDMLRLNATLTQAEARIAKLEDLVAGREVLVAAVRAIFAPHGLWVDGVVPPILVAPVGGGSERWAVLTRDGDRTTVLSDGFETECHARAFASALNRALVLLADAE